jgi:hypothetical protein
MSQFAALTVGRRRAAQVHIAELEASAHELRVIIADARRDEAPAVLAGARAGTFVVTQGGRGADVGNAVSRMTTASATGAAASPAPDNSAGQQQIGLVPAAAQPGSNMEMPAGIVRCDMFSA